MVEKLTKTTRKAAKQLRWHHLKPIKYTQYENTFPTWLSYSACCPAAAVLLQMCSFPLCQHLPFQLSLHQVHSSPILPVCSGKIPVRFAWASDLLRCINLNNVITIKLNMHLKETRRFTGCKGVVGDQLIEWEIRYDQEVTNNKHDRSLQSAGGSADANEWWPFFRLHYSRDSVNNEHSLQWPLWMLCRVNTHSQRLDLDEPHLVCLFAWLLSASSVWHRLGFFQTSGFCFSNDFVSRPSSRVYYHTLPKNWDKQN